jgi:malate synthase
MTMYDVIGGLQVARNLRTLLRPLIETHTTRTEEEVWSGFAKILSDLQPKNVALLHQRDVLQGRIDAFLESTPQAHRDADALDAFLTEIGYLVPEGADFEITPQAIDPEIARLAGPQLVVPISNPRFALNALNARWGSLFDALYGTDAIAGEPSDRQRAEYDPDRGQQVIEFTRSFLDQTIPLSDASHKAVIRYFVDREPPSGRLSVKADLDNGRQVHLADPAQFRGFLGRLDSPTTLLFQHNGLHVEIQVDPGHPVGRQTRAGVRDVLLEAALTVIQDFEDSVAAVDVEDKLGVYRHWAGLIDGSLEVEFEQAGRTVFRRPRQDRYYLGTDGDSLVLKGRGLMLVRTVGLHTCTSCVRDLTGTDVYEGILDTFVATVCALPDLRRDGSLTNSAFGRMYLVKPKLHGPEEVTFTCYLLERVERLLSLEPHTIGLGVMDEERRTSANLKECIRAARDRIIFINTGFLDRTGDEIHTTMAAGPMLPKEQIRLEAWFEAYEKRNVGIGLDCGFPGKAQIGKGMWPKPDNMAEMLATKSSHLQAGASCSWVPSPAAAVLHALHYHQICVRHVQDSLRGAGYPEREALYKMRLLADNDLTREAVHAELRNNAQSILGYVVRWVDQGVGCSKVPDIHGTQLMEDLATLRISSQHIANWLRHRVCSAAEVEAILAEIAALVDRQNASDPAYRPLSENLAGNIAFRAARKLVFGGACRPNGYTETVLREARQAVKASGYR